MTITNVQFLPIVKEYARRINLVDAQMTLQPGIVILAMVLTPWPVGLRVVHSSVHDKRRHKRIDHQG
jgi:ABC-type dipeptide/oligopeptide/nickel transport system permease subunit